MGAIEKMVLPYLREVNQSKEKLKDDELEYMARKFNDDVRRWLKARADFDPREVR